MYGLECNSHVASLYPLKAQNGRQNPRWPPKVDSFQDGLNYVQKVTFNSTWGYIKVVPDLCGKITWCYYKSKSYLTF